MEISLRLTATNTPIGNIDLAFEGTYTPEEVVAMMAAAVTQLDTIKEL